VYKEGSARLIGVNTVEINGEVLKVSMND